MDSQPKLRPVFAVVRNYRELEEKRRKRKGSFHARPSRTIKKQRKLTETFDSTNRLDEEAEQQPEVSDVLEQYSREVSKMRAEEDELELCIPVNLTEGELDDDSPFKVHKQSNKIQRSREDDQGDDLTI